MVKLGEACKNFSPRTPIYLTILTPTLPPACDRANALMAELDEAYKKLELPDPCTNRAKECEWWAAQGGWHGGRLCGWGGGGWGAAEHLNNN